MKPFYFNNLYKKNTKNFKPNFNKKSPTLPFYFFIILSVFSVLLISFFLFFKFIFLPQEISILAGDQYKIDFNIPSVTTITSEDEKLNINNNSSDIVNDNSEKNPIYIYSEEEGSHNLTVSMLGVPISNITVSVLPEIKLIPSGQSIGVRINTDGIMVLGFGEVVDENGDLQEPTKNLLKAGDMILKINDEYIDSKEMLATCVKEAEKNSILNMQINRKDEILNIDITPICDEYGENKIGVWVRDSTQGVGTLTYIDPISKNFGSLGHGIVDVDTKEIMQVKNGKIMETEILDIKKGEKGSPGELVGDIKNNTTLGEISLNSDVGIYGTITDNSLIENKEAYSVGLKNTVEVGEASILCTLEDNIVKEYSIQIDGINKYSLDNSKSMVIKITDPDLLNATSGIIQGMSGSPILQNNKIIGAVTHVFVNDPTKGYGIFIENMLTSQS